MKRPPSTSPGLGNDQDDPVVRFNLLRSDEEQENRKIGGSRPKVGQQQYLRQPRRHNSNYQKRRSLLAEWPDSVEWNRICGNIPKRLATRRAERERKSYTDRSRVSSNVSFIDLDEAKRVSRILDG